MIFRVLVAYADGDNFAAGHQFSHVEIEASSDLFARLGAIQMAATPMPGKPDHIQILSARAVRVD